MSSRNPTPIRQRAIRLLVAAGLLVATDALLPGSRAEAAIGTLVSACNGSIGCANKINLRNPVDTFEFHAKITAPAPISPLSEPFTVTLSNANGVFFTETLAAGQIKRVNRRFQFRDAAARRSSGFGRITIRRRAPTCTASTSSRTATCRARRSPTCSCTS
jgi:hypothetical protein